MKKRNILLLTALFLGLFLGTSKAAHAATIQELRQKYLTNDTSGRKVRILIVPGHDEEFVGTSYRGVKEADLNVEVAQELYNRLSQDPRFDVLLTRTKEGYTSLFSNYFLQNRTAIQEFIAQKKDEMIAKLENGSITQIDGVPHNNAPTEVGIRLYGINKWANENNIDIVYHIHFNDNPNRPRDNPGPYQGFVIYVPERQYAHAAVSQEFGRAMFGELNKYYPQSNLARENAGVAEDQELIAIGASNTVTNSATVLAEYGYIYEPQFLNPVIRTGVIKDMAFQTFLGFHRFFGDQSDYRGKFDTTLLPYSWTSNLKEGILYNPDVLRLLAALRKEGLYPVAAMDRNDCRMTGHFDPCTKRALIAFQKKYKITSDPAVLGTFGPRTRQKLNLLFGS